MATCCKVELLCQDSEEPYESWVQFLAPQSKTKRSHKYKCYQEGKGAVPVVLTGNKEHDECVKNFIVMIFGILKNEKLLEKQEYSNLTREVEI